MSGVKEREQERLTADREFHVQVAKDRVQNLDPALKALISRLVLVAQDLKSGQETQANAGKELSVDLNKAVVTLLFDALKGSYMISTSDKEGTTQFKVTKL